MVKLKRGNWERGSKGVHVSQINLWKKQLLEAVPKMFSRGKDGEAERIEPERNQLHRKVGQLQIEVDWHKKRPDYWTKCCWEACGGSVSYLALQGSATIYGSRRMKKYLRSLGYKLNWKRVQRLMNLMGLSSIAPRKRTTVPGEGHKIYPYLLRNLETMRRLRT